MYHRQPNPDLPAIREEDDEASSSTPASSTSNTPVEHVDDDIETSSAISYANSYAFTLDNVGLDEENSLVGSVVGSVIGLQATRSRDSLVHTPPSQVTPERISRHERKLHRETCRTLGLPYSYDTLTDSSPSSGSEDAESTNKSIGNSLLNCGVSVNSGSADGNGNGEAKNGIEEKERKRKIDKLWPWPTASIKSFKDKQQQSSSIDAEQPLDQMKSNVNQDVKSGTSSGTKLINAAKLSDSASTYTNRMKEAFASFNERIEEAYQKANPDRPQHQNRDTTGRNVPAEQPPTSSGDEENVTPSAKNKRPKTVQDLFQPGWVQSYKESYTQANPLTKLTVGATVLFMLICIIALLAMVSVSQSDAQSGNGGSLAQDGVDVTTHHDLDNLLDAIGAGETGRVQVPDKVVSVDTIKPTLMPSQKPTASPFKIDTTLPGNDNGVPNDDTDKEDGLSQGTPIDVSDKEEELGSKDEVGQIDSNEGESNTEYEELACLNKEGKFNSSQGKPRKCHWLTNTDPGALVSSRLENECGGLPGQLSSLPSELGLNCRHACRAYNGCMTSEEASAAVADYLGKSEEGDVAKVDRLASRDEETEAEESIAKVQSAPEYTNAPTGSPITPSPTSKPSNEATSPFPTTYKPTNKPTGSPVAEETTLDLSTSSFTDIRGRDRQCWWLDIRNRNQRTIRRNANCVRADVQAVCSSSCRSYMTMAVMNHNSMGHVLSNSSNTNKGNMAPLISSSPMIQLNSATIPSTTLGEQKDDCSDEVGFFLNNHGQVRQCSWLINDRDPTDETRRMDNCDYGGSGEATDLGRMCRSTCGTC